MRIPNRPRRRMAYQTAKIRPPVPAIAGCLSFAKKPLDLYPGLSSKLLSTLPGPTPAFMQIIRMQTPINIMILAHLKTHSIRPYSCTPHAFMKYMVNSKTKVADVIPKLEGQYCVNMAAAMVKVTMLIQLASQYTTPTVNPRASSTKVCGKSMRGADTGRTDTISARHRMTEKTTRAAKM
ncbi:MAG: hypothetical protein Q9220_006399 [cf. Caloplaca sp. 1 TL-2023]